MNLTQMEGKKARSVENVYDDPMTAEVHQPLRHRMEQRFSTILKCNQEK